MILKTLDDNVDAFSPEISEEERAAVVERWLAKFVEDMATPRERYYMRHTKKQRVLKKYRNRVVRRLVKDAIASRKRKSRKEKCYEKGGNPDNQ